MKNILNHGRTKQQQEENKKALRLNVRNKYNKCRIVSVCRINVLRV